MHAIELRRMFSPILTIIGGTCRLRAEVSRPQLRLQLLCDGLVEYPTTNSYCEGEDGLRECPMTDYVDCDTYDALNISQGKDIKAINSLITYIVYRL